jgi:PAS domain S-box-containing protein
MGEHKRGAFSAPTGPRRLESGEIRIAARVAMADALVRTLDQLGQGLVILDASSERIVSVNATLCDLCGASADELADVLFTERVAAEDAALLGRRLRAAADDDAAFGPMDVRLAHSGGGRVHVEMSASRFDGDGGDRLILCLLRDVTPQRRDLARLGAAHDEAQAIAAEHTERLSSAYEETREALRSRDHFFSMAAHELRTPLTPLTLHVQGLLRAIQSDRAPSAQALRTSLAALEKHVSHLTRLIDQMLDLSRLKAGRMPINKELVDLALIVRDVAARFAPEAERLGARIVVRGEERAFGRWDPLRIDQVVTNLVSNALKYGQSDVDVLLRADGARTVLEVKDRGQGIARDDQARIFQRFERVARDARARGVGLGLWIAREVVVAHGGEINVVSEPGEGATFVVDLPCDPEGCEA